MWPPRRRPVSAPRVPRLIAAGARRNPAQIHQIRAGGMLEEPSDTGFSRTPFRLACRTRTVWQCRSVPSLSGLLPPSPATPGSGCPQLLPGCCDIPTAVSFHHRTVKQRLVAHQVAFPMSGNEPVCGFDRPLGDHDHVRILAPSLLSGASLGSAPRATGPEQSMGVDWKDAPILNEKGLIDGLVGNPHVRFIRELLTKRCRYLLR